MKIGIIGGGTAGWMASLIIKSKYPNLHDVFLIADEEKGILGVGESTTGAATNFLNQCCGNWSDFWSKTGSMPKLVKKFVNWNGIGSEFYCPIDGSATSNQDVDHLTYVLIKDGKDPSLASVCRMFHNVDRVDVSPRGEMFTPLPALHLDTHATSLYLKEKAIEKGIRYINGKVSGYNRDASTNHVVNVTVGSEIYEADFWIDASGFSKVLSSSVPFVSFSEYLPVNRAISTVVPRDGDYKSETISTAMSSGWVWDIPTAERRGVGYVFCDKYQTKEDAVKEFEQYLGCELTKYKYHEFESGMLESCWNDNVLSIGVAASFLEPLQATSIHTTISQVGLFCNWCLRSTVEETCKSFSKSHFNKYVRDMIIDFRDLVNLNYSGSGIGTPFWKNITLTDNCKNLIGLCNDRILTKHDFRSYSGAAGLGVWFNILTGLGHISKNVVDEYGKVEPHWYQYAQSVLEDFNNNLNLNVFPNRITNENFKRAFVNLEMVHHE